MRPVDVDVEETKGARGQGGGNTALQAPHRHGHGHTPEVHRQQLTHHHHVTRGGETRSEQGQKGGEMVNDETRGKFITSLLIKLDIIKLLPQVILTTVHQRSLTNRTIQVLLKEPH